MATAVGSKFGYLLSGPLETATLKESKFLTHSMWSPNQPEQFWSVESVRITLKDELTNSFLDTYVTNNVWHLPDGSYNAQFL